MSACGLPTHGPTCRCGGSTDDIETVELVRMLAEHHVQDSDALGVAARLLLERMASGYRWFS